MGFFWKKEQSVINKIKLYLEQIDTVRDNFRKSIEMLMNDVHANKSLDSAEEVHLAESRADDIRRDIELTLYQKALIPESRGDVLGIIESIDKIPGMFESLCYQLSSQMIEIPAAFKVCFLHLIDVNIESCNLVRGAVLDLFYSRDIQEKIKRIDEKESESDRLERILIRDIFKASMDKADKILLKEIVVNIGNISDLAEITADRVNLAVIKRRM